VQNQPRRFAKKPAPADAGKLYEIDQRTGMARWSSRVVNRSSGVRLKLPRAKREQRAASAFPIFHHAGEAWLNRSKITALSAIFELPP
jgi:hypothetical protein